MRTCYKNKARPHFLCIMPMLSVKHFEGPGIVIVKTQALMEARRPAPGQQLSFPTRDATPPLVLVLAFFCARKTCKHK